MSITYNTRHAIHPNDSKAYDTAKLREAYLIEDLFQDGEIRMVYTLYDRLIVGGAQPTAEPLLLETTLTPRSEQCMEHNACPYPPTHDRRMEA
ncbi:hypothetical protein MKJ04_19420 [Pontibacter sp. E15-1]|uniref:hypothetical protein n=1 Tax=Pontibacter sp. E15-1 TaxID=2919918 RepID=UPI001F4F2B60|nr:hypothetical protein [Pontibacter sp. E15-1]MCJ8167021.1 hypothetical protein [Pontibacter sp. E15-1]